METAQILLSDLQGKRTFNLEPGQWYEAKTAAPYGIIVVDDALAAEPGKLPLGDYASGDLLLRSTGTGIIVSRADGSQPRLPVPVPILLLAQWDEEGALTISASAAFAAEKTPH